MVSKPSVFWTQFTPYGALYAVLLHSIFVNRMLVPFIIFSAHSGELCTKNESTDTVLTFHQTNGIGLPG